MLEGYQDGEGIYRGRCCTGWAERACKQANTGRSPPDSACYGKVKQIAICMANTGQWCPSSNGAQYCTRCNTGQSPWGGGHANRPTSKAGNRQPEEALQTQVNGAQAANVHSTVQGVTQGNAHGVAGMQTGPPQKLGTGNLEEALHTKVKGGMLYTVEQRATPMGRRATKQCHLKC